MTTLEAGIRLKRLGPEAVPEVLALWQEAGMPFRPEGRDDAERFARELERGPGFLIGAVGSDGLVGVVLGTEDGRKGWINRMAVHPAHRRRGLARRLVEACEEVFKERGIGIVCCLIEDWNAPSLALFQGEGYDLRKDIFYLRKLPGGENW